MVSVGGYLDLDIQSKSIYNTYSTENTYYYGTKARCASRVYPNENTMSYIQCRKQCQNKSFSRDWTVGSVRKHKKKDRAKEIHYDLLSQVAWVSTVESRIVVQPLSSESKCELLQCELVFIPHNTLWWNHGPIIGIREPALYRVVSILHGMDKKTNRQIHYMN